ncbi:DNA repair endonuclease XPF [Conglomerata obtusa]
MLLEFQKNILEKSTPISNLLILAKGLGLVEIMYYQINFYVSPNTLTFLINYSEPEIVYLQSKFDSKYFTCDVPASSEKRKKTYVKGGVFVVAQQTLISDLINEIIDVNMVSAVFISNVDNISRNDMTAFIIDVIRKGSRSTIIRGYTDNVTGLNFEEALDILQIDKAIIFPRFEVSVKNSIVGEIEFTEKRLKLCREIEEIQILLLEIIRGLLNELKREDKYNEEFKNLVDDFDLSKLPMILSMVYKVLDKVGYKNKVRRLYKDIKNFVNMIALLFNINYECFFEVLQKYWDEQIQAKDKSTWINLDSGLLLMEKAVLFAECSDKKNNAQIANSTEINNTMKKFYSNAKSDLNIIDEKNIIENYDTNDNSSVTDEKLIENDKNNKSIETKLLNNKIFNADKINKDTNINYIDNYSKKEIESLEAKTNTQKTLEDIKQIKKSKRFKTNIEEEEEINENDEEEDFNLIMNNKFITKYNHKKIDTLIHLLHKLKNRTLILTQNTFIKKMITKILLNEGFEVKNIENKQNKLFKYIKKEIKNILVILTHNEYKLSVDEYEDIVFLNSNLGSIRKIELLQSKNKNFTTKVYSIIYKNSLEEQKLLNDLRNENEVFKKIIHKNANIAIRKIDNTIELEDLEDDEEREFIVYVDFREMRSTLPYFLWRSNNLIKIMLLDTGDYILGKDTAIERKSISDFISSINSGRLYLQAKMISYKYKNAYLLIEFNRRTCLADYYEVTEKFNLLSKFVTFLSHFPRIKIIWSNSELMTLKIFRNIQKREKNPKLEKENINPILLEILLSVPGIEFMNYKVLIKEYKNLKEIAQSSIEKLIKIVGQMNGTKIYNFFNQKV